MEAFERDVEKFLDAHQFRSPRREAIRLAASSCVKGLMIREGEGEGEATIARVHLDRRDAVLLRFVKPAGLKPFVERWEKQRGMLRYHHLFWVADRVCPGDAANPELKVYFYL
jgi:hypothetical protein